MLSERPPSVSITVSARPGDALPVEQLQLRPAVTRALHERGLRFIGDLSTFLLGGEIELFPYAAELAEAVCQLESCRADGQLEWPRYWRARDFRFHHFCASLPALDRLSERARTRPVDREVLGLAGLRLSGWGYRDLGTLVDALRTGIPLPQGIGPAKLRDFFERLADLADNVDDEGELGGPGLSRDSEGPASADIRLSNLPDCVASVPVHTLCIGAKSVQLRNAGYRTVGHLAAVDPAVLLRLPSVGRKTVLLALDRIAKLHSAVSDGEVDWREWCSLTGLPLIPDHPLATGRQVLFELPSILGQVAVHTCDPIMKDLVSLRLLPAPHDRATIDEIAARHARAGGRSLSRQRVHQLERQLLRQLAGALIRGRDLGLDICFHPGFTRWWRLLAKEFNDSEEITVDDFLGRLASAWDVSVAELIAHLPVICAIVTGDTRLPPELRHVARLPAPLHALEPETAATSLKLLRLGKRADQLEDEACTSLCDLVAMAKAGRCPDDVLEHLDLVSDCIELGQIDWQRYREILDLPAMPPAPPHSAADFASDFAQTIRSLLEGAAPTGRRAQIFWQRTRFPVSTRPTLEVVASALGTYSSGIKREETELLEELHRVLVQKQFAKQPSWFDERWLSFVDEAHQAFTRCGEDFDAFGASLAVRWNLTWADLEPALPSLWAIFTGYPIGRRRTRAEVETVIIHEPGRIRLRGFRTVH